MSDKKTTDEKPPYEFRDHETEAVAPIFVELIRANPMTSPQELNHKVAVMLGRRRA